MVFKMEEIAVVIPVYNGIGVVDKSINALKKQSIKPSEIVCVDDASPDDSSAYIKEKYPEVTVIRNKVNIGASGAYGIGLYYAYKKGYKWIWLLDQDSIPAEKTLETLVKLSRKYYKKNIIFTSTPVSPTLMYVYTMLNRRKFPFTEGRFNPNIPYKADLAIFSGLLLSDTAIEDAGLPLSELTLDCADQEYTTRLELYGWRIFVIPNCIVYHKGGILSIAPKIYRKSYYKLIDNKIINTSSKYQLVSIYPETRYFTRGMNIIRLLRLSYTPNLIKIFLLYWLFGTFIKLAFSETEKISKIKSYLHGISYGMIKKSSLNSYEEVKRKSYTEVKCFLRKTVLIS